MGQFSEIVRRQMNIRRAVPARANPELPAKAAASFLEAGQRCLDHLAIKGGYADDPRCRRVREVLEVAYREGTLADARTALTQLQTCLRSLTEEDADVSSDLELQNFRRQLHMALDH